MGNLVACDACFTERNGYPQERSLDPTEVLDDLIKDSFNRLHNNSTPLGVCLEHVVVGAHVLEETLRHGRSWTAQLLHNPDLLHKKDRFVVRRVEEVFGSSTGIISWSDWQALLYKLAETKGITEVWMPGRV